MTPLMNVLLFLVVCLMTVVHVGANSLDKRASPANNTDEDNYYNIYTKIDALEKDMKNLETRLQKKKKLLRQVLQSVLDIDSNPVLADNSLKKQTHPASKKNAVGFTTRLQDKTYSSSSSIIQGGEILYNGGNAYNGTVFTCPIPGLYLFHVTLLTTTKYGTIWIYKNSQKLTSAYAGDIDPQYKGVTASAAVWLDVGDQVYLRPRKSLYVYKFSAFTGVKSKLDWKI